ncbi:hypothetical protein ACFE04_009278 [Oxalis oulophora]
MAPSKRKAPIKTQHVAAAAPPPSGRVTRSSTRLANGDNSAELPTQKPSKKKAKTAPKKEEAIESEILKDEVENKKKKKKTIVIEHCKQCNQFKTRAIQVKNGLEKGVPGINVLLNPDKPRRGCFEIREEDGEIFISLLSMKRPFAPMKALDMDEVISELIGKPELDYRDKSC